MNAQLGLPGIDPFAGGFIERSAFFPEGGNCRAELGRRWALSGPVAGILGCNPSDAGVEKDDPTSSWLIKWCRDNGFAAYKLWNIYPFITSSPRECQRVADWQNNGPDWWARDCLDRNLCFVRDQISSGIDQMFVCFGRIAWDDAWVEHFLEEIFSEREPLPLYCWGFNQDGTPKHPMARGKHRIPAEQKALIWRRAS